jgi:hypothetical protein
MEHPEPTQELVRELIAFNERTGELTWKRRDRRWFCTSLFARKIMPCDVHVA